VVEIVIVLNFRSAVEIICSSSCYLFVALKSQFCFNLFVGNIAVHLFLEETRRMYDLETLWTVGIEYDDLSRRHVMDEVTTATTLEEFSFDAELERLRKLRGYVDSNEQTAQANADSMESQGNWHKQ